MRRDGHLTVRDPVYPVVGELQRIARRERYVPPRGVVVSLLRVADLVGTALKIRAGWHPNRVLRKQFRVRRGVTRVDGACISIGHGLEYVVSFRHFDLS